MRERMGWNKPKELLTREVPVVPTDIEQHNAIEGCDKGSASNENSKASSEANSKQPHSRPMSLQIDVGDGASSVPSTQWSGCWRF